MVKLIPSQFQTNFSVSFEPVATAHILTAEEAENCNIHDIVMPLPGYDVIYPSHHGKGK